MNPYRPGADWTRRRWLDEKIRSGELPAPGDEAVRRCDALFAESGDLESHLRALAAAGADDGRAAMRCRERVVALRALWSAEE